MAKVKPKINYELFRKHPAPSWLCQGKELNVVDVNNVAVKSTGISLKKWKKQNLKPLISGSTSKGSNFLLCLSSGIEFTSCTCTKLKLGNAYYYLISTNAKTPPGKKESKGPEKVITGFLEEVFYGITDGMFSIDREWKYSMVNPSFCQLAGLSREQMIGKKLLDLFPFMSDTDAYRYYKIAMENKTATHFQIEPGKYHAAFDVSVYPFEHGIVVYYRDVTEKRYNEINLIESRNILNAFFNSSLDINIVLNKDGKVIAFNNVAREAFVEITGIELTMGIVFKEHPELAEYQNLFEQALNNQDLFFEKLFDLLDGTSRYYSINVKPNKNEKGETVGVSFNAVDNTEQKKAEAIQKESEDRYRTLFEINPAPMWVYDQDTLRFIDVNKAAINHFGYTHGEFLKMTIPEIAAVDDLENAHDALNQSKLMESFDSSKFGLSHRMQKKNGDIIIAEVKSHNLPFKGPKTKLALSHDITQFKEAQQALEASEQLIRNLADNLPDGAIYKLIDQNNIRKYAFLSSGITRLTGYEVEEILNNNELLLSSIHPEDQPRVRENREKAIESLSIFSEEFRQVLPDGSLRWLQVRAKPRRVDSSTIILDGIVINLDEQKKLEQRLIAYEHRLQMATTTAKIGVWELNYKNQNLAWDEMMHSMFGFSQDDHVSPELFSQCVIEEDLRALTIALEQCIKDKVPLNFTYRIRKKDTGELRYIMGFGQGEYDSQGNITKMIGINYDITQLKQSEIAIRESEARFRLMADHAPVFIWMDDENFNATYFSKGWYEFTGCKPEEVLGNGWRRVIHPDDLEGKEKISSQAFDYKDKITMEYRLRRHDGEYRWMLDTGVPRFLKNGDFTGYIGSCIDITERKMAEKALLASEARYRSIVEDQQEMICRYNAARQLVFANHSLLKTFGIEEHQLPHTCVNLLIPEEHHRMIGDVFNSLSEENIQEKPLQFELTVKDGKKAWHEWQFMPIKNNEGVVTEVQGIGRDITYRKKLEHEQKSLDKIVRESYNEIYLVNYYTLRIEYANDAALTNTGFAKDELYQITMTEFYDTPDAAAFQKALELVRSGEQDRMQIQLKHFRKDHTQYDVTIMVQVLDKNKTILIIANDITDELITEKKLLSTIHEKETLLREIHHRVKNNLQLISSLIYLKYVNISEPHIRDFLHDTRHKIKSIAMIHEKLLQTETLNRIDISSYLNGLIAEIKASYGDSQQFIRITCDIESKTVNLDTAIFCGLMVNELVTNAFKHAFKGRISGEISISLQHENKHTSKLIVADNGITLPTDISPGEKSSYGMELLHIFIRQLGGRIEILRNQGTAFHMAFSKFI